MHYPMFNPGHWQLKSCPKCGGDRCLEITEGVDLVCIQCGHRTDARPALMPVRGRPVKSKFKRETIRPLN